MKFENERERKIYESGFFAGKNSKLPKPNYTQEEIEELRICLNTMMDFYINDYAKAINDIYRYPDWYKKIPWLRKKVEEKEQFLEEYLKARNFLCYVQSKAIPEYLEHINTKKK